ncbi:triple gene block 1 protein [Hippeastrum latent virus]|uniref:Triple gene block 1 protein n=1 Tax=Hippeastrum latent virus TaxID=335963 RepID=Q4F977_9VIRU|nr:triple gene block 1 protein [Hippeastrum latent virus]AAZ15107.1 triple gene block 1 protein [Hippeastrum latent virus]
MDILLEKLNSVGFVRIASRLRAPLVVHCVPGAGKSTLIRELLIEHTCFKAYTGGSPGVPELSGRFVRPISEFTEGEENVLIDEYTLCPSIPAGTLAVFGDPCQPGIDHKLTAHFICKDSKRFGSQTSEFLCKLGFEISAKGQDEVVVQELFDSEPRGVIVFLHKEVECLLRAHSAEGFSCQQVQGKTFDEVCFISAEPFEAARAKEHYICLTRHRKRLQILCPNATYTTS